MTARRLVLALLFALVGAGTLTFLVSRNMSKHDSPAAPKQQYVAATKPLDAGETLQKANLNLIEWSSANKLDGGFLKVEDVVGRTVLYPVSAGEPILDRQLAAPGAGLGLSGKIPAGMRAISLKTDQVVGVAGFLLPGTHVDVLVTFRTPEQPDPVTSTVLQDAEIVAAGQKTQPDPEGKATTVDVVTLLVKPNDAERVTLASQQGTVHFILRNGGDHEQTDAPPAELTQLGGTVKPVSHAKIHKVDVPAAPVKSVYTVQTVAGGKQTSESFQ